MPLEFMNQDDSNNVASSATGEGTSVAPQAQSAATQEGVVTPAAPVEGSPATVDGAAPTTDKVDASTADSATAEFPEEPPATGEIKEGWKNLRSSYQKRKEELQAKDARIAELEALIPQDDYFLKIDAPVDQLDFSGQLDQMKEKVPDYYNALGWTILERHLPDVLPVFLENPQLLSTELRGLVEASATSILQTYTGLQPQQIADAVAMYKQQNGYSYAPVAPGVQSPSTDVSQIAAQFGLDPMEPSHQPLINFLATQQKQLTELQNSVQGLASADEQRVVQSAQGTVAQQIDSMRSNLLSKVAVPTGYEYVMGEINDRLNGAFERDPLVRQARADLEAYHRQGTPDLKAAARLQTTLQTRMNAHFKEIVEPRLREIAEVERLKTLVSKQQVDVKNPSTAGGTVHPTAPARQSGVPITSDNAADIALERYRASKLGRPSTT